MKKVQDGGVTLSLGDKEAMAALEEADEVIFTNCPASVSANDDAPGVSEAYAEIDGGVTLVRIIGSERAGLPPECLVMSFPHPLPHSAEAVYAMLASIMVDPVGAMLLLRASCSCTRH